MRRLTLVANPWSSGFTGSLFRDVVARLSERYAVTPIWPVDRGTVPGHARRAAAAGADVVVAMGGDGVVHLVANGLIDTSTALGIIPVGTTNVVARIHGVDRDPIKAAQALLDGSATATSVVHITAEGETGSRSEYALFAVGVGFDADVVEVAERRPQSKEWFGSVHFARAAAGRVIGYRNRAPDLTVSAGGAAVRAVALFVQVHDVYTYFGRLPMSLAGRRSSGPIAGAVERLGPFKAGQILGRLLLRRDLAGLDVVRRWDDFAEIVVTADGDAPLQADGEHLGRATAVHIRPRKDALLLVV